MMNLTRFHRRLRHTLSLAIAAAFCSGVSAGELPIGISKEKPADGPAVAVDNGFMVPYKTMIPGTDIPMEMVPVPGGELLLGSPEDEEDREDHEGPQVKVKVDPMWVGKTEVNWLQYKEYMRMYGIFKEFQRENIRPVDQSNLADAVTAPTELYEPTFTFEYGERPEQPATTMSLYAAKQYTKWLSAISSTQYRLPTEAEWEYAARAGSTSAFSFGDSADDIDDYAWYFDNAEEPQAVGTKKPNAFGLHDMHGNAAELTVSAFGEDGYAWLKKEKSPNATTTNRWIESGQPFSVRGGSWEFDPEQLRSASRLASDEWEWKDSDPNFPKSPWWYTDDPTRGIGMRVFRSYKPLPEEQIKKFWETTSEETGDDVKSRVDEGRGGYGLVDPDLPKAIKGLGK